MFDLALFVVVFTLAERMALDGAVKIVVEVSISIEVEEIAEENRVTFSDFVTVFGVEIEGGFLVVGVVSLVVMFLHFDLIDVAVIDIWQNTTQ